MYNIINIQSVKYPDIKGELIFDEFLCLYDKSNHVDLNNGKRYGTLNLFYVFSQYKLNFIDIKNKIYKYKLLLNHDSCSIKEVEQLNRNFNDFIKSYGDCYKPLKDFNILVEVSNELTWRMCYSMTSGNVFINKKEYFSEKKFRIEKNSENDIFRAIIELMKYMSEIESADNEKFLLNDDYIDDIIENQNLTKNKFKELFETLELLKY